MIPALENGFEAHIMQDMIAIMLPVCLGTSDGILAPRPSISQWFKIQWNDLMGWLSWTSLRSSWSDGMVWWQHPMPTCRRFCQASSFHAMIWRGSSAKQSIAILMPFDG